MRPGLLGIFGYRLARLDIVEASAIGVIGLAAVTASLAAAPGWRGGAGAVLAALMLAIAVIDYRRMIIPDELNALAFMAGLAAAGVNSERTSIDAILEAVIRAGVTFALFFAFRACYQKLRGIEGIGFGDVKLAAVAGIWLDLADIPIAVNIAAISALGAALCSRLRGNAVDRRARLPFGAFFAPAIWICWLLTVWRGD